MGRLIKHKDYLRLEAVSMKDVPVWVIDDQVDRSTFERLGEAHALANGLQSRTGIVIVSKEPINTPPLIHAGADHVVNVLTKFDEGARTFVTAVVSAMRPFKPRIVLVRGDSRGRERAARLAVRMGWRLISPTLLIRLRHGRLAVTNLDSLELRSREVELETENCVVVTYRPGVAEQVEPDTNRLGETCSVFCEPDVEYETTQKIVHVEPSKADIRHLDRLMAGGKGMGDKAGFELLARVATRLRAGVAASRVAVDLEWASRDRQVGQTGKTVAPKVYIACGISGASHHLEGMSESQHIVAVNTDPNAPIFRLAHLGCACDVLPLLKELEQRLKPIAEQQTATKGDESNEVA